MMIQPVIFCTIVLGVGSVRSAAQVGKLGGPALTYFLTMSTVALAIGLVVGNILKSGAGLELSDELAAEGKAQAAEAGSTTDFLLGIIPDSLLRAHLRGDPSDASGCAAGRFRPADDGACREPTIRGIEHLQRVVFRVLAVIMLGFYATCIVFVFVILGLVLKLATGVNLFSLLKYLGREFLLILSTSSSESALPRLIAKMEHAGVDKTTVGVVVPPAARSTSTAPRST